MVLVAERSDPATGERRILAVGRLNKLHAGNEAEVAVLVSDNYQNLGLGNELLARVVQIARDEKLGRVSAEMLPDNVAMQVITKRLGFRARASEDLSSVLSHVSLWGDASYRSLRLIVKRAGVVVVTPVTAGCER
jgi:acetyltransferase